MRKEIQSLMSGKALPFMAAIAEKIDIKAAAEYEIQKMKVAKTLIREKSELDEDDKEQLRKKVEILKKDYENALKNRNQISSATLANVKRTYETALKKLNESSLDEKLHGKQHKLDHNEDGDIDAEDMKTVKKKGANNDHPLAEDSMSGGGESLKPGQVIVTATSVKAKNKKGESRTWPWHSEYDDNKHIDKSAWFKEKKLKAQEFARG